MLIKYKVVISIIFFVIAVPLFSQSKLSFNDSTLSRGIKHEIVLMGSIPEVNEELKIRIKYNALLLDITSVHGGTDFAIKDPNPIYFHNMSDLENSILEITSRNYTNIIDGMICSIVLEALAGPDSLAVFEPIEMTINGSEPINTEYSSGTFSIGSPIFEKFNEHMSNNQPDPFNTSTVIPFTLSKETNVEFRIFTLEGAMVDKLPGTNRSDYKLISKSKEEIEYKLEDELPQGSYLLEYTPNRWEISQGAYYIVMKGSKGIYLKTMRYIR